MDASPIRYRSDEEDSGRWLDFAFRDGDIVISTRSKSGTTWMQMICALLIFQTPHLPRPLVELSPWLDWLVVPKHEIRSMLAEQSHRRFIKTHTPLDGLPLDPRATYIVVGRHPLDAAVSRYHQSHNIDRRRKAELTGNADEGNRRPLPPLDTWLRSWIRSEAIAADNLDSMAGVFHHLTDAWRRRDQDNVVLIHYGDLIGDLPGEMARLADQLDITLTDATVDDLANAATFDSMRTRAGLLVPDAVGVLVDSGAFFRRGRSGAGVEALGEAELAAYRSRAAALAPPDLLAWLHRD